jgi:hypothetical protein
MSWLLFAGMIVDSSHWLMSTLAKPRQPQILQLKQKKNCHQKSLISQDILRTIFLGRCFYDLGQDIVCGGYWTSSNSQELTVLGGMTF